MPSEKNNTLPKQGFMPRQIVRPYYQSATLYSFPFKQNGSTLARKVEKVVESKEPLQAGQLLKAGIKE